MKLVKCVADESMESIPKVLEKGKIYLVVGYDINGCYYLATPENPRKKISSNPWSRYRFIDAIDETFEYTKF